jgi:hypothetical protein
MQVHSHHALPLSLSGPMKKNSTAVAASQSAMPTSIALRSSVLTGAGSGRRSESFRKMRTPTGYRSRRSARMAG